uniref:(California timema) hypothetical protein n=1 Tax=Timema californicum TaxID=61474 RepID=A0A7R9PFD3_TIMCA|nr:unnamed protein product [Timema californicum]
MSKKELNDDRIRSEQLHTNRIEDHVRERIYSHVVWTPSEDLYRTRDMCFCRRTVDPKDVPPTNFTTALNRKVRYSFIGCFLKELNSSQKQEKEVHEHKLSMLEFDWNCHWDDTIYVDNDLCNDVLGLMREAASRSQGAIGSQEVLLLLDNITLVDCMITDIDEDIKTLRNLKALSLSANWITTLYGGHLPSSLEFLDLYGNFISDVTSLSCDLPEWLLHLGLGRNRLSDRHGWMEHSQDRVGWDRLSIGLDGTASAQGWMEHSQDRVG